MMKSALSPAPAVTTRIYILSYIFMLSMLSILSIYNYQIKYIRSGLTKPDVDPHNYANPLSTARPRVQKRIKTTVRAPFHGLARSNLPTAQPIQLPPRDRGPTSWCRRFFELSRSKPDEAGSARLVPCPSPSRVRERLPCLTSKPNFCQKNCPSSPSSGRTSRNDWGRASRKRTRPGLQTLQIQWGTCLFQVFRPGLGSRKNSLVKLKER